MTVPRECRDCMWRTNHWCLHPRTGETCLWNNADGGCVWRVIPDEVADPRKWPRRAALFVGLSQIPWLLWLGWLAWKHVGL